MKRVRPDEPRRALLVDRAREMRLEPSLAERKLWAHLRGEQLLGLRFRRQYRVEQYIVDFCCPSVKLVVEVDGDSHADQVEYDANRTKDLNRLGLHVMRFTNFEVIRNIRGVYDAIEQCCASRLPPLPSPLPDNGERG